MSIAYNPGVQQPSQVTAASDILQLQGVTFRYRRGQADLGPLTLSIADGDFVCVVGPSGSGKSTLLGLLAGFLKPQEGSLTFAGRTLSGPDAELTLVQQEHALFPWRTVQGNVEFGLELRGVARRERAGRALNALRMVGLEEYASRRVHELSGGQKQRVAIARAFVVDPKMLLMDEPFSALDVTTRQVLGDELLRLWKQSGKTVLFVTHNLEEALRLGQRVIALNQGEVVLDRPARQLDQSSLADALA